MSGSCFFSKEDPPESSAVYTAIEGEVDRTADLMNRTIICDQKVFQDCCVQTHKAVRALNVIDGVNDPNCLKVAGAFAFWIRKLKPFRFIGARELADYAAIGIQCVLNVEILGEKGDDHGAHLFVNEILAVAIGCSIASNDQQQVIDLFSDRLYHDLIVGLRYRAYSENAVAMVLEAISAPVAG